MPKRNTPADAKLRRQFAARLHEAVESSGKSRTLICEELGTHTSQLSRWENAVDMTGGMYMLRLPLVLRCDGHWLLTGEGVRAQRPVQEDQARLALVKMIAGDEVSPPSVVALLRQFRKARALQSLGEAPDSSTPSDEEHGGNQSTG